MSTSLQNLSFIALYEQIKHHHRDNSIKALMEQLGSRGFSPDFSGLSDLICSMKPRTFPDGFLQHVILQLIIPESVSPLDKRTSHMFFSYLSTQDPETPKIFFYDQLIQELFFLIGRRERMQKDAKFQIVELILARTDWGRKIILEKIEDNPELFNKIICANHDLELQQSLSIAFEYINDDLLRRRFFSYAKDHPILFNQNFHQYTVERGKYRAQTVLLWLFDFDNQSLLSSSGKSRVLREISDKVLNQVVKIGSNTHLSVAFLLSCNSKNYSLFFINGNTLSNLINEDTLNHVIEMGPYAGQSVAYRLSRTPKGRALLAVNEYRLLNLINEYTLNYVIKEGPDAKLSVAYLLASTPDGQALLLANQQRLLNLIHQDIRDQVITEGPYADQTIDFCMGRIFEQSESSLTESIFVNRPYFK